ncbi:50S ribosomal protein L32 [Candidatus Poribacteria bacterium]|nr:50S ribosomal protein L32 [Candidatus Poribacteria bacterium]MDE0687103.1 50S ribosomal protein L32 [Candidatus Poribacteria bacterium]MXV82654.1 50S ribosomal protein L32 [Candidatus Poribacteria bacterium]MYA57414.1 50S ribosomal protein L32 [Candidatus Poribacteria bacterium]
MAHPKRRTSKSKKRMRRSHNALHEKTLSVCSYCGETIISHQVCSECGHYNGRPVLKSADEA